MDLNVDLAEGLPYDRELLGLATSANVACGGHAGSRADREAALLLAAERGVVVGAHPGYPDREHFGRRALEMSASALLGALLAQVGGLQALAGELGVPGPRYLKPHGALYHRAVGDAATARVVVAVAAARGLAGLLHAPGALTAGLAAEAGVAFYAEGFADRRYRPDGGLVARGEPGATLAGAEAAAQAAALAERRPPPACPTYRPPALASLCVHGDGPGAPATAQAVREALLRGERGLASFLP